MKKLFLVVLFGALVLLTAGFKQIKNSYNAGELSEYMAGRTDINKYHNGCSKLINAVVLPHGGIAKRPGTEYIATAPNKCKLFSFEFSVDDALVLGFSNELLGFYKDGAQILDNVGTETLTAVDGGALIAHWLLNETTGTTIVNADNAGTYDGTATVEASTLHADGKVGTGCFDLDGQYTVEITHAAAFSFTDDSNDSAFSLACWAYVTQKGGLQVLLSKWQDDAVTREWRFSLSSEQKLQLHLIVANLDLSSDVIAQWKLNDDAADTNIVASLPAYTITAVDADVDTVTFQPSTDISTDSFPDGSEFTIAGSNANDGQYTVVSTAWVSPNLTITIAAASLTDANVSGTVSPHAGVSNDSNTDVITTTGKINECLDFGGDQAVIIDDSADFSFGNSTADSAFSLAAWIYFDDSSIYQTIVSKNGSATTSYDEWLFAVYSKKLRFICYDRSASAYRMVIAVNELSVGWHFVVATYDGTGGADAYDGMTLYVDGSPISTTTDEGGTYVAMENLAGLVRIGAAFYSSGVLAYYFRDKIDNVVIFDIELTQSNITALWNDGSGTETMSTASPIISAVSDSAVTSGWHFLVCTYDATNASYTGATAADYIALYVDGVAVESTATNNADYTAMQTGAEEIRIGSQQNSAGSANENFFQDKIDEVSVFSDVLTPTEVASLYSTTAYSITSPYTSDEAFEIHTTQSADVMYIAHDDHHPQKLSRYGDTIWTLEDVDFTGGPFLDENVESDYLVGFARTGGTARSGYYFPTGAIGTLTASDADSGFDNQPFNTNMVGALWLVKHTRTKDNTTSSFAKDDNTTPTAITYASHAIKTKGDFVLNVSKFTAGTDIIKLWRKEGNGEWQEFRTFTVAVVFSATEAEDDVYYAVTRQGAGATVLIEFTAKDQTNRGIVEITAFTSSTVVTVEVIDAVLSNNSTDVAVTTSMWAEGAWSDYRGFPRTVTFYEDRLWWASSTNNPDTLWSSRSSKYEEMDFTDLGLDDDALIFPLSDNEVSQIQWMFARQVMAIGAANKEYRLSASNPDNPITPSDRKATPQTSFGSDDIQPIILNDAIFFFQRQGKKLRAMKFDSITENFVADDATLLAYTMFDSAPTCMAVQRVPDSIIWTVRTDGVLPTFTYEPDEEVAGWARQITQNTADVDTPTGYFESVAVIHGTSEDEVWVSVRRIINSNTVYYIEKFESRNWGDDIEDASFVDSGVTYDSTATSSVTAAHLKGETLAVFADGVVFDDAVANASTGVITLKLDGVTTTASTIQYGLPYTMKVRTMRLSVPSQDTTFQTRIKRIHETTVRYIKSLEGEAGQEYGGTEYLSALETTYSTASQDDTKLTQGGFSEDAYTVVVSDDPVPFTLLATIISFEVEEYR